VTRVDHNLVRRPGDLLRLGRYKWPGTPHRTADLRLLLVDGHGLWLDVPPGRDLGDSPGWDWAAHHRAVLLVPSAGDWVAYWSSYGTVYVDIGLLIPPCSGDDISFIDLDLDVYVDQEGTVMTLDEAEFKANVDRLAYPAWVIDHAHRVHEQVLSDLSAPAEPFASAGNSILRRTARPGTT
jgi:hypothetical protein